MTPRSATTDAGNSLPAAEDAGFGGDTAGLNITMCGVRGSIPAPGRQFSEVGGHTSCVAIGRTGEVPSLLLDAGTGVQHVTKLLSGEPFRGDILLTHLHWDHVWGLPFFRGADVEGSRVRLGIPRRDGVSAEEAIDVLMAPPLFPIDHRGLLGDWTFSDVDDGEIICGDFKVLCLEIPHKGGRTFGFRIEGGGVSVAYLPDHSPCALGRGAQGVGSVHEAALALADRADLLIHGGQFTASDLELATHYGHATVEYALDLAQAAGTRQTVLTHHAPSTTDDRVVELENHYANERTLFAREGDLFVVEPGAEAQHLRVDSERILP